MRYFHGGIPGLRPGGRLLPAADTGKGHPRSLNQPNYSPRRVYLTSSRWYAELFAHYGEGDVYEVRPIGQTWPDADARGSAWCRRAEVVAVLAQHPVPPPQEVPAVLALLALLRTPDSRAEGGAK